MILEIKPRPVLEIAPVAFKNFDSQSIISRFDIVVGSSFTCKIDIFSKGHTF